MKPDAFTAAGKQVLRNNEHYCTAITPAAAANIAAALNAWARGERT